MGNSLNEKRVKLETKMFSVLKVPRGVICKFWNQTVISISSVDGGKLGVGSLCSIGYLSYMAEKMLSRAEKIYLSLLARGGRIRLTRFVAWLNYGFIAIGHSSLPDFTDLKDERRASWEHFTV